MSRLNRKHTLGMVAMSAAAIGAMTLVQSAPAGAALPSSYVLSLPQGAILGYAPPTAIVVAGQPLTFINADTTPHSVTAIDTKIKKIKFGKKTYITKVPLFDTKVIAGTATALVTGVESLKPGSYKFLCTLHTGMKGTLTVK